MQEPICQIADEHRLILKFSNFCLQSPLQDTAGVLTNSIRNLSTISYGDPILKVPSGLDRFKSCKVTVRVQPSLLMASIYPNAFNTVCSLLALGKVSPAVSGGITVNGQPTNVTVNTTEDNFILPYIPSIIDFSAVAAYFANDVFYNTATYAPAAGNVHRYQAIIDVSVSHVWPQ